jgi:hypothetical protein
MFSLCCYNVEEVVIPDKPELRLAKEEIGKLSITYAKLVGRKFGLEPVFPSLKDIDLPAATAMVTSLKEKIETITAELNPGLVLRTPMSPENRAEIIRLRAEYEALDPYPCVCPYGPIDDMDQQSAISHLSTLRIWISARKIMKEREATRINAQMSASNTRYSMDMTRGGGGSMSDWVGSDGHTLPGFPGPPREYTEAKLAQTRTQTRT